MFFLHCPVVAFPDWFLGTSSWDKNPSSISLLGNCDAVTVKVVVVIIIMMIMIIIIMMIIIIKGFLKAWEMNNKPVNLWSFVMSRLWVKIGIRSASAKS